MREEGGLSSLLGGAKISKYYNGMRAVFSSGADALSFAQQFVPEEHISRIEESFKGKGFYYYHSNNGEIGFYRLIMFRTDSDSILLNKNGRESWVTIYTEGDDSLCNLYGLLGLDQ